MFMAWQDLVGGRLETRNRFAKNTWDTFPLPKVTKDQRDAIIEGAVKVLNARNNPDNGGSALSELYSPGNMPKELKKAHDALDRAMDSVFGSKPFKNETERQSALLQAYKIAVHKEEV